MSDRTPRLVLVLVAVVSLAPLTAEARFGKRNSPGTPSGAGGGGPSSSASNGNHQASAVGQSPGGGYRSGGGWWGPRSRVRFFGGGYVPYAPVAATPVLLAPSEPQPEYASPLRVTAGLEAQGYLSGFTLVGQVGVEGERWGFTLAAQNIAIASDTEAFALDMIQQAGAKVSFAFLSGELGRLRLELGADAVFAADLIAVGPTGGFSGVLYLSEMFALEGSFMVTPWPFRQLDGRAGLGVGLGPVGLRAGWRWQVLDDQGLVDGVVHSDLFTGPYVGLAVVF